MRLLAAPAVKVAFAHVESRLRRLVRNAKVYCRSSSLGLCNERIEARDEVPVALGVSDPPQRGVHYAGVAVAQ